MPSLNDIVSIVHSAKVMRLKQPECQLLNQFSPEDIDKFKQVLENPLVLLNEVLKKTLQPLLINFSTVDCRTLWFSADAYDSLVTMLEMEQEKNLILKLNPTADLKNYLERIEAEKNELDNVQQKLQEKESRERAQLVEKRIEELNSSGGFKDGSLLWNGYNVSLLSIQASCKKPEAIEAEITNQLKKNIAQQIEKEKAQEQLKINFSHGLLNSPVVASKAETLDPAQYLERTSIAWTKKKILLLIRKSQAENNTFKFSAVRVSVSGEIRNVQYSFHGILVQDTPLGKEYVGLLTVEESISPGKIHHDAVLAVYVTRQKEEIGFQLDLDDISSQLNTSRSLEDFEGGQLAYFCLDISEKYLKKLGLKITDTVAFPLDASPWSPTELCWYQNDEINNKFKEMYQHKLSEYYEIQYQAQRQEKELLTQKINRLNVEKKSLDQVKINEKDQSTLEKLTAIERGLQNLLEKRDEINRKIIEHERLKDLKRLERQGRFALKSALDSNDSIEKVRSTMEVFGKSVCDQYLEFSNRLKIENGIAGTAENMQLALLLQEKGEQVANKVSDQIDEILARKQQNIGGFKSRHAFTQAVAAREQRIAELKRKKGTVIIRLEGKETICLVFSSIKERQAFSEALLKSVGEVSTIATQKKDINFRLNDRSNYSSVFNEGCLMVFDQETSCAKIVSKNKLLLEFLYLSIFQHDRNCTLALEGESPSISLSESMSSKFLNTEQVAQSYDMFSEYDEDQATINRAFETGSLQHETPENAERRMKNFEKIMLPLRHKRLAEEQRLATQLMTAGVVEEERWQRKRKEAADDGVAAAAAAASPLSCASAAVTTYAYGGIFKKTATDDDSVSTKINRIFEFAVGRFKIKEQTEGYIIVTPVMSFN